MNKESLAGGIIGTAVSSVGAGLSLDEVQQIISIVATCIGAIITIISCVVIPFIKWYKKAKEDGKITPEEAEEGKEILQTGIEGVKDVLDKKEK